ncbi:NADH dehydrogenase [ubiquinone] flavoprotein 3, mitochondrial isoform X1 [Sorex araneus]|uniref:NADH dehydrogenase [ubiquinone] flavoprotein 3, mitochondrial isoform X1 n=1 Tax=Sorex araneus TaxID=42254 RepID=UPI00243344A6|nr:NADH dehydrogenase [ubiquinone] flavoprotein 3, mitochondrial isoform X1 [Sorex araneus]
MAALLLLRQGRAAALQTLLREAPGIRGLGSTVPLSAESGKADKGQAPGPKKQSPPKNVVESEDRAPSPAGLAAAKLAKSPSLQPVGRVVGPKAAAAKTTVAFPQRDPPPRHPSSGAPLGHRRDASSSSSSSSSSDSESDEEGDFKDRGRAPKPAAPRPYEKGAPRDGVSTADTCPPLVSAPEKPPQATKKGSRDARAEAATAPPRLGQEPVKPGRGTRTPGPGLGGPHAASPATPQPQGHVGPRPPPGPARQVAGGTEAAREVRESSAPRPGVWPLPGAHEGLSADTVAEQRPGGVEATAGSTRESAPPPPVPEPFDNSTYRNLQHHEYTVYTFLDVNLQLAKQRLPQPSSGRESPRH